MSKVNVREIVATFRVVTPLFSAGADPTGGAELRVPSLKGVLRFWWRALAWSELGGDLPEIQKEEEELFGSGGEGARRSRVVMFLEGVGDGDPMANGAELRNHAGGLVGHGVRYLGYGLMGAFGANAGKITRACRRGPLEFKLHLRCRGVDDGALDRLLRALCALGTVGGLGARSRRGFGSLVLTSLTGEGAPPWRAPGNLEELRQELRRLTKGSAHEGQPAYTAFSTGVRHVLVTGAAEVTDPLVLLDRVGREMVRYRSYGSRGRIFEGTQPAESNFRDDHDLVLAVAQGGGKAGHPRRVAFGLPHNYYFSEIRKSARVGPAGDLDRRASPLFIHIHAFGSRPVAVLTFLPAKFLPGRVPEIQVGSRSVPIAAVDQLYRPIHAFLDRMMGKGRREPFGEALEVRYDAR